MNTDTLTTLRERTNSVLVMYSGGKDSRVCVDLAKRLFDKVELVFMYFIPDLELDKVNLTYATTRWGLTVRQYPHWGVVDLLKTGMFCTSHREYASWPEYRLLDVYELIKHDTGINYIISGGKKTDSLWRRRMMSGPYKKDWMVEPLKDWNKYDVLYYLKTNNIEIPASSGRSATGVDLSVPSVLWLHDNFPDDYKKLLAIFPFAGAIVYRRDKYGIK